MIANGIAYLTSGMLVLFAFATIVWSIQNVDKLDDRRCLGALIGFFILLALAWGCAKIGGV